MAMLRRLSNLGIIALAAREQPTVREALHCLQRTMHLHNEAMHVEIEEANDVVVLRERSIAQVQGSIRQGMELTIAVLHQAVREFLGDGWTPRAVCFTHSAPRDLIAIASLQLQRSSTACRTASPVGCDLDRAMPRADPQSLRTLERYLDAAGGRDPTCAMRTTRLILGLLPGGLCTAEFVAGYLAIDRRTLHRKLAAERTSFSELMDDVRRGCSAALSRRG